MSRQEGIPALNRSATVGPDTRKKAGNLEEESQDFGSEGGGTAHVLTVNAEEYFQGGALARTVRPKHWERLEPRFGENARKTLELLDRLDARATFFVFGWNAERDPDTIRRIVEAGHEVASRGYWPHAVGEMVPEEFREELARTKEALLRAGVPDVHGFRAARWLRPEETWALDILMEEGYRYDASINPLFRRFAGDDRFDGIHRIRHKAGNLSLVELPVSTTTLLGLRIPISGGNYWRQLPQSFIRRALRARIRRGGAPLVLYFTPWELDPDQPMFRGISKINRIRQYRNLERIRSILEKEFEGCRLESAASILGLDLDSPSRSGNPEGGRETLPPDEPAVAGASPVEFPRSTGPRTKVTIVVPLFNEAPTITYLSRTLADLRTHLGGRYEVDFLLVDDHSTDATLERLRETFEGREGFRILPLSENRGVAGAILEGIRAAESEIVCSIDCDCSYDPAYLEEMIPLFEEERADLVTASPYHPEGRVYSVPNWRLFLSKNLSRLYNLVLGRRIHTYTSCFRVYRRSAVLGLELEHPGFLGIAELLIEVLHRGGKVIEFPATLESRLLGTSKMKTLRTILGHLKLLASSRRKRRSRKDGRHVEGKA